MRHRNGSLWQVLGIIGVISALIASLALTLAYRGQLIALKGVIYGRCLQRQSYDTSNHNSVGADIRYLSRDLALVRYNAVSTAAVIHTFPAKERAALTREQTQATRALEQDLVSKQAAYAHGVIGSCSAFQ